MLAAAGGGCGWWSRNAPCLVGGRRGEALHIVSLGGCRPARASVACCCWCVGGAGGRGGVPAALRGMCSPPLAAARHGVRPFVCGAPRAARAPRAAAAAVPDRPPSPSAAVHGARAPPHPLPLGRPRAPLGRPHPGGRAHPPTPHRLSAAPAAAALTRGGANAPPPPSTPPPPPSPSRPPPPPTPLLPARPPWGGGARLSSQTTGRPALGCRGRRHRPPRRDCRRCRRRWPLRVAPPQRRPIPPLVVPPHPLFPQQLVTPCRHGARRRGGGPTMRARAAAAVSGCPRPLCGDSGGGGGGKQVKGVVPGRGERTSGVVPGRGFRLTARPIGRGVGGSTTGGSKREGGGRHHGSTR